jgi:Ca2+-binding EF-hand superfamily protein
MDTANPKSAGNAGQPLTPPHLTPDATNKPEYREAFALFDKRGTGQVPRESLGELLRSLGQNPTQAEVNDLERQVGGTCTCCSR